MNENNQPQSQQTDINRLQFEAKLSEFISSQQSIPPDIAKVVRERFWDLIEDTRKAQPSHSPTEQPGDAGFNKLVMDTFHELYPYSSGPHLNELFVMAERATKYERSKQAELVAENQKLRSERDKMREALEAARVTLKAFLPDAWATIEAVESALSGGSK